MDRQTAAPTARLKDILIGFLERFSGPSRIASFGVSAIRQHHHKDKPKGKLLYSTLYSLENPERKAAVS